MASSSSPPIPPVAVSSPLTASRVSRVSFSSASDACAPLGCGGGGCLAARRLGALGSGSDIPSPFTGLASPDDDDDAADASTLLQRRGNNHRFSQNRSEIV